MLKASQAPKKETCDPRNTGQEQEIRRAESRGVHANVENLFASWFVIYGLRLEIVGPQPQDPLWLASQACTSPPHMYLLLSVSSFFLFFFLPPLPPLSLGSKPSVSEAGEFSHRVSYLFVIVDGCSPQISRWSTGFYAPQHLDLHLTVAQRANSQHSRFHQLVNHGATL